MMFSIKNLEGKTLYEGEFETLAKCVESAAIRYHEDDDSNLEGADLDGIDLSGARLRCADLRGASLRGTHLRGANLHAANLKGANLEGASLRGADLMGAHFAKSNLNGANLRDADLRCVNFRDASLMDADLRGARLDGSTLPDYKSIFALNCSLIEKAALGALAILIDDGERRITQQAIADKAHINLRTAKKALKSLKDAGLVTVSNVRIDRVCIYALSDRIQRDADLHGADLRGARLDGASLRDEPLSKDKVSWTNIFSRIMSMKLNKILLVAVFGLLVLSLLITVKVHRVSAETCVESAEYITCESGVVVKAPRKANSNSA